MKSWLTLDPSFNRTLYCQTIPHVRQSYVNGNILGVLGCFMAGIRMLPISYSRIPMLESSINQGDFPKTKLLMLVRR
jgi:hypothetical protein